MQRKELDTGRNFWRLGEQAGEIDASAFGTARHAPFQVAVPTEKLARGSYLLSISAERADGAKTRSDLVFRIR